MRDSPIRLAQSVGGRAAHRVFGGVYTGLLEQRFTNVRMGLSAHLEGVMNGILLLALGARTAK